MVVVTDRVLADWLTIGRSVLAHPVVQRTTGDVSNGHVGEGRHKDVTDAPDMLNIFVRLLGTVPSQSLVSLYRESLDGSLGDFTESQFRQLRGRFGNTGWLR